MGPEPGSASLPTRPRFSWDIRNVPWTDGKGNQEEYAKSVDLWNAFHDKLPDSNSNKISAEIRGRMLQSQLYGRARDMFRAIPDLDIQSSTGWKKIVEAIYKRDSLSVQSDVYQSFTSLLAMKRGANESFKNFESRFVAQVSKFNATSSSSKLPEALTAFILLANSAVDNGQRISVLAAASNGISLEPTATTDDYLKTVSYEKVASVLRQSDQVKSDVTSSLSVNAINTQLKKFQNIKSSKSRHTLTPAQFADLNSKIKCHECQKFGHWRSDHNSDGSLKPGAKSSDIPTPVDPKSSKYMKKTVTFNMVQVVSDTEPFHDGFIGPLLDDGAPYSGMGLSEFMVLQPLLLPKWNGNLQPIPEELLSRPFWQYGNGEHSSESRKILGSVLLHALTDNRNAVQIRHLIIDGSSQWLVGRNVTRNCNIEHIDYNSLVLPNKEYFFSLIDHDLHSYVPYKVFRPGVDRISTDLNNMIFCATAQIGTQGTTRPWCEIKQVVDKVHKHVCGHSSYSDIKILLERNKLWNSEVQKYLSRTLDECPSCLATSQPKDTRKVSLSSLTRQFNTVVCVDHFHLGINPVFHIMDSSSRYSVGDVVESTSVGHAIPLFETLWVTPFWAPDTVLFDPAFGNREFTGYLDSHGIEARPIPPRRHNKNVLESKHRVIRDIYLRLKVEQQSDSPEQERMLVQAIRISNDLYGNDVCSAQELAKGYTRPLSTGASPVIVPTEILEAHNNLLASRKLNRILRAKSVTNETIHAGDTVQVFVKEQFDKRGKWSSPKVVLSYDKSSATVTVPGKNGRKMQAATEDVRIALPEDSFASIIQNGMEVISTILDECISEVCIDGNVAESHELPATDFAAAEAQLQSDRSNVNIGHEVESQQDIDGFSDDDNDRLTALPSVGDNIEVYWPLDDTFYPDTVASINDDDNKYYIDYTDGQKETLNMPDEVWRYSDTLAANNVQIAERDITSTEQTVLGTYVTELGHRDFMQYQAQVLPTFPLLNAYNKEEETFKKTVQMVPVSKVPQDDNVITSHVIYKVKTNDDGSFKMKARIAPHGNKDAERSNLKTDSSVCPPTGIRILLSLATIFQWCLAKIDFKSAFLQTGDALRDVYVVPPRESDDKMHYWLLLTAAYGLVNANAKWQKHSDELLRLIGLSQLIYVPQLFYKFDSSGNLLAVAIKIVDDLLMAGPRSVLESLVVEIQSQYELGTVFYGPGTFLYFGLQICQDTDYSITIQGDDKLNTLSCYPISRQRRKQGDEVLNAVEAGSFRSINSSLGWLGIAASPFCAFYASHLQQKVPLTKVHDLISQINSVRFLQKLGPTIRYKRPTDNMVYSMAILVFADASRTVDYEQLGYIAGLLIGNFKVGTIYHSLSWSSHKSKRPVKSIGAAEILAAGEAIDEGKVLAKAYQVLLGMQVDLIAALDSKDLFESLSTCRNSIDRFIRADVSVIRYEFETHKVNRIVWIPGKVNLADPLTKTNSPLGQPLQLSMFTGELALSYEDALSRSSVQSTG